MLIQSMISHFLKLYNLYSKKSLGIIQDADPHQPDTNPNRWLSVWFATVNLFGICDDLLVEV